MPSQKAEVRRWGIKPKVVPTTLGYQTKSCPYDIGNKSKSRPLQLRGIYITKVFNLLSNSTRLWFQYAWLGKVVS
jgi:hypothetical protein